ncbi:hypothetical protein [Nocardia cyriacigeorgica]|uniref:hypothetical protein n=1 Tax=Nocardia cyriacigeorgica TaxID=135487 RepID=UPI0011D1EB4A|nr:hypothetical protein [Nocardia cyriacigeorgica]
MWEWFGSVLIERISARYKAEIGNGLRAVRGVFGSGCWEVLRRRSGHDQLGSGRFCVRGGGVDAPGSGVCMRGGGGRVRGGGDRMRNVDAGVSGCGNCADRPDRTRTVRMIRTRIHPVVRPTPRVPEIEHTDVHADDPAQQHDEREQPG